MAKGFELAREYHRNLPPHVREYLQQARGISREVVDLHLLGWNGTSRLRKNPVLLAY